MKLQRKSICTRGSRALASNHFRALPIIIILALTFGFAQTGCRAAVELSEERMAKLFDWVITLKVIEEKKYWPRETATSSKQPEPPAIKVAISYRLFPRPGKDGRRVDEQKYEELYYKGATAIGSHRFAHLELPTGEFGAIRIAATDGLHEFPSTAADAVIRMYMDVIMAKNKVGSVIVPQDAVASFGSTLPSFNFFLPEQVRQAKKQSIYLAVISDPVEPKLSKTYFYTLGQ